VSLASEFLAVLDKFRAEVASHVNSGQLVTIDHHIDTIASVAEGDVEAADAKAKAVLSELYTAVSAAPAAPVAPVAEPTPVPTTVEAAPVAEAAPVETEAPAAPTAS
jgi:hypothetical protein